MKKRFKITSKMGSSLHFFKRKKRNVSGNLMSLSPNVKILKAHKETSSMSREETESFLREGRKIMRVATLNKRNEPYITPVWYLYKDGKIFFTANKNSRKIKNIRRKNVIAFCIDRDSTPYRGIRGTSKAKIVSDPNDTMEILTEMIMKYLGNLRGPWAQRYLEEGRNGNGVVVEIEPKIFVTWT